MTVTLNQVLGIILTVAAVVAVTFLVLFLNQLRKTAREGEKTLAKAQEAMDGLQVIEAKINSSLDNVGEVLATSKRAVTGLSGMTHFLTSGAIRPSARSLPFLLPLLSFGLRHMKKKRRKMMAENKETHFWDSLLTFAVGAAAGFIVGILIAPASGKETRKKIKDQAARTGEVAKDGYEKIAKEAEKGIRAVKEKTGEGVDAIRDFIEKKKEEFQQKAEEKK